LGSRIAGLEEICSALGMHACLPDERLPEWMVARNEEFIPGL